VVDDNVYVIDEGNLDIFQVKKKKRITSIKEILKKLKKIDLKTFVSKVAVKNGFDTRTVRKYLSELEDAGEIEIKEGTISI
jgi:predicted transcriptional regulator